MGLRQLMIGIASLGGLLFGYETAVGVGALTLAGSSLTRSDHDLLLLTTCTLLSALIGALVAGRIADLVGRRDVIMTTAALFTLGAFISAAAPSEQVLLVGRVVVGLGVGAISVAAPLYIAEIASVARRGASICFFPLMIAIGVLLAYIGIGIFEDGSDPDGWRILFAASAIPGLMLSGLALLLVESPVWLAQMDDHSTAVEVQARLGLDSSQEGIDEIVPPPRDRDSVGLPAVFAQAGRGAVFTGMGLFFVSQFVGLNAILYYSPASLEDPASLDDTALDFGPVNSTGTFHAAINVAATLLALLLIDRVGRRPLLKMSLLGTAVALAAMGLGAALHSKPAGNILASTGLYLFILSFAIGIGTIAWVTAAEMLPIHVRGLAMGLVVASFWLFDGLASPTGLLLRSELGLYLLIAIYMCCALGGYFVFRRRFPEAKGLSLAAIDRYFNTWAARMRQRHFAHYVVGGLGSLCGLLNGYNFAVTAVTLVLITEDWKLNAFQQGVLASTVVAGVAVGAAVAGLLSDRFGRRYVLMSMAALFVASAFGATLAPSLGWLIAARAAAGIAIGVSAPTTGIYVAELAPAAIRGRLLSIQLVANALGVMLAYCVGLVLVNYDAGWRLMFGFPAVLAAIFGLALLPLIESPRWLVAVGQLNAARRSLRRLVGDDADRELAKITVEPTGADSDDRGTDGGWARLWRPPHRPAVTIGLVLAFLSVFTGDDMVLFYAPTVLKQVGFDDTAVTFAGSLGLGAISLVATVIAFTIVDRVGRKPMVITGLFVMAACMLGMAALTTAPQTNALARWGLVACLAVFVAAFGLSLAAIIGVLISEIYPQSIRGRATSLSGSVQSVFAIIFVLTFPLLLQMPGLTVTLLGYAVIGIVGALYLMRALPETKSKSLEEIAEIWNRRALTRRPAKDPAP